MIGAGSFADAVRALIRRGGESREDRRQQVSVLVNEYRAARGAVPPLEDVELLNDYIIFGG